MSRAKAYYLHPKDMHRTKADAHGGCVKHLVVLPSDLDKVIERAARAMCRLETESDKPPVLWSKASPYMKEYYRDQARAAYRAGGFCP